MPASQDMYAAQSLDMDANVDATDLLLEYARSMHMHTKRQMDSNSSPVAPTSRLANAGAAPIPGRSNTSSSTSSETDDQSRAQTTRLRNRALQEIVARGPHDDGVPSPPPSHPNSLTSTSRRHSLPPSPPGGTPIKTGEAAGALDASDAPNTAGIGGQQPQQQSNAPETLEHEPASIAPPPSFTTFFQLFNF